MFLGKKWNSGLAMKTGAGCEIDEKKEREFGIKTPTGPDGMASEWSYKKQNSSYQGDFSEILIKGKEN